MGIKAARDHIIIGLNPVEEFVQDLKVRLRFSYFYITTQVFSVTIIHLIEVFLFLFFLLLQYVLILGWEDRNCFVEFASQLVLVAFICEDVNTNSFDF